MWFLLVIFLPTLVYSQKQLTDINIEDFIVKNEPVIIFFTAPWCHHCEALKPEFSKAAEILKKKMQVNAGMADCEKYQKIVETFRIEAYPTLRLFYNGKVSDYVSGRTTDDIVNWVTRKMTIKVEEITNHEQMNQFMENSENRILAVYKPDMVEEIDIFKLMAENDVLHESGDYIFGTVFDKSLIPVPKITTTPALVLYKNFEDKNPVAIYEGSLANPREILGWIQLESIPIVINFSEDAIFKIFAMDVTTHMLLFISEKEDNTDALLEFEEAAEENKLRSGKKKLPRVLFVTVIVEQSESKVLTFFGVNVSQCPRAVLIETKDEDIRKFLYRDDVIEDTQLTSFIQAFSDGSLVPWYRSQSPPKEQSGHITQIVGDTFNDEVKESPMPTIVFLNAEWCSHCQTFKKTYKYLAKKLKDTEIKFCEMDGEKNEVPGIEIDKWPMILLFK